MLREDTYSVRASIGGVDLGEFAKMSGGEIDSEESKFHPGGLQEPVVLGGRKTIGNVTVSRFYAPEIHAQFHDLVQRVGNAEMVVTRQPLDAEGVANGRVITYSGMLKGMSPNDIDSEGGDAALLELEMTVRSIS